MREFGIRSVLVIALILSGSIPLLLFGWYQGERNAHQQVEIAERRMLNLSESIAREVGVGLEHHIAALSSIADQTSYLNRIDGDAVQNTIELYSKRFKLKYVYMINLKGITTAAYPLVSASGATSIGTNFSDREYFKETLRTERPFIAHLRLGRLSGRLVFGLAVPVWNRDRSKLVAVLGSSLTAAEIYQMAQPSVQNSDQFDFVLVDGLKQVLLERENTSPKEIVSMADNPIFMPVPSPTVLREGTLGSRGSVRAAVSSLRVENVTWTVAVFQRQSDFFSIANKARLSTLLLTTLVLSIAVIIALLISSRISNPIIQLVDAMKRIGEGTYKSTERKSSNFAMSEVKQAWSALDQMALRLREQTENLENFVKDRTQQLKAAYKNLEQERDRTVATSRLAALGEMAAGIAHEINTPLATITIAAYDLRRKVEGSKVDPAKMLPQLSAVEATARRIGSIVEGLREFSRDGTRDQFKSEPLGRIIEDALALCKQRFHDHGVELRIPRLAQYREVRLDCRRVQLTQVLVNLLTNAFDAVEGLPQKWVEIDIREMSGFLELAISDSGPGVSPDIGERCFEPFFTTKDIGKGAGLGLSISRGMIEQHGGMLTLESGESRAFFSAKIPRGRSTLSSAG